MPRRLPVHPDTLALVADLIAVFRAAQGRTRGELDAALQVLGGNQTNYRLKRGLAHLLVHDYSTFPVVSPVAPAELRQRVFDLSAQTVPSPQRTSETLTAVADALGQELGRAIGGRIPFRRAGEPHACPSPVPLVVWLAPRRATAAGVTTPQG